MSLVQKVLSLQSRVQHLSAVPGADNACASSELLYVSSLAKRSAHMEAGAVNCINLASVLKHSDSPTADLLHFQQDAFDA